MDDLDALYEIYDETVTRYVEALYEDRKEEEEFTIAYIKNMYGFYGYGVWIVELKDGTIIGRAGISNRSIDGEMELEIGYVLGSSYRKQGYASEAVGAVADYAFQELDADKINCFIQENNISSIKLAERLGFSSCGKVSCDGTEYLRYIKYP